MLPAILDTDKSGAESADQNRRLDPMPAYLAALHRQTAPCPTDKDLFDVHEGRVDTFCTAASGIRFATTCNAVFHRGVR